jgi:hypothetical protein
MPRLPAKSLISTAASPPDTSLDPPRDAEELRSAGGAPGGHRRPTAAARRRFPRNVSPPRLPHYDLRGTRLSDDYYRLGAS